MAAWCIYISQQNLVKLIFHRYKAPIEEEKSFVLDSKYIVMEKCFLLSSLYFFKNNSKTVNSFKVGTLHNQ